MAGTSGGGPYPVNPYCDCTSVDAAPIQTETADPLPKTRAEIKTWARQVWLIQSGTYEDRYVVGIASSLDAGVRVVKERYGAAPQVVTWRDPYRYSDDNWSLAGEFDIGLTSCWRRKTTFHFQRYDVDDLEP